MLIPPTPFLLSLQRGRYESEDEVRDFGLTFNTLGTRLVKRIDFAILRGASVLAPVHINTIPEYRLVGYEGGGNIQITRHLVSLVCMCAFSTCFHHPQGGRAAGGGSGL